MYFGTVWLLAFTQASKQEKLGDAHKQVDLNHYRGH